MTAQDKKDADAREVTRLLTEGRKVLAEVDSRYPQLHDLFSDYIERVDAYFAAPGRFERGADGTEDGTYEAGEKSGAALTAMTYLHMLPLSFQLVADKGLTAESRREGARVMKVLASHKLLFGDLEKMLDTFPTRAGLELEAKNREEALKEAARELAGAASGTARAPVAAAPASAPGKRGTPAPRNLA